MKMTKIPHFVKSYLPTNRPLPNLIIIGGQRCGTTSLYDYLSQHPETNPSRSKELHFFDLHYKYGLKWYRHNFNKPLSKCQKVTFESSPYYLFHPAVPARIKAALPACKFIVMLRNPIERAYSHYWHEKKHHRESLSFEEALQSENSRIKNEEKLLLNDSKYISIPHRRYSYFSRGCYAKQIRHWLEFFPDDQFLFIESDSFFNAPQKTMNRVHEFVNIKPFDDYRFSHRNKGSYESPISDNLRQELENKYREENKELKQLINIYIDW